MVNKGPGHEAETVKALAESMLIARFGSGSPPTSIDGTTDAVRYAFLAAEQFVIHAEHIDSKYVT